MQFGIGHPPPTHQLQSTCVREGSRIPNLQTEFNYLDSFKSYGIFSDFVVPVVPMLSPSSSHCPRVIPIAPRRSPCGPHGCGLLHCLRGLHPMLFPWSPWSPCHLCHPHIIPVLSLSPHVIPIAPRRSPCGPHGCGLHGLLRCLRGLHPMLSPWSPWSPSFPRHPHRPHVIPISSRRSPHHPQPPRYPLHLPPTPMGGWGAPNQYKCNKIGTNQDILILFEDLKSVETPPPMGGCMGWWVGGCMGGLMDGARSNH